MSVHEYRTGSWIALVGDGAVALLHPEVGTAAVRELWELTRSGSRLGTWVEHLAGGGIRALPSFAMVEAHRDGLNVLVRGDLTVDVGGEQVTGAGFTTWREQVLPGGAGFTITAGGADAGAPLAAGGAGAGRGAEWLPVVGGIVLADSLRTLVDVAAGEDNHAGLQLADHAVDADEEDLELTLLRTPALAAAIGRPAPSSPAVSTRGVDAADGPAEASVAGPVGAPDGGAADAYQAGPADADQTDSADVDRPSSADADLADSADAHLASSADAAVADPAHADLADSADVDLADPSEADPADVAEQDPADDAEYDHLLWSTEQLAAEDAEAAAEELVAARSSSAASPASADEDAQGAGAPSAGEPVIEPAAHGPATPPGGLEATQVPHEDDDAFAPPAADAAASGGPVHRVRWDDEPAAAPGADSSASSGLIDSVPWAPRPAPAPVAAADPGDHDGETVMAGDLPAAADVPAVATEGAPAEEPTLELLMSTGARVEVTRPVLLGRAPEATRFRGNAVPRLVTVPNPERDISGTHAEIRPAGDHVVVTDMNSTNGTVLNLPGQPAFRLHPGTGVPVPPGGVIELGSGVSVTVVRAGEDA
ncbi:FHA domain-containing protein [Georgenia subflava]|uniref:FHA domain-containing protein n=1 Tax=Georgenia subflava TaxID=1622177 RepID=A0A6N7EJF9_9MICO|nr:FHA domain-containing protein [Georgenia subflava]MPV37188.1 FHA domain-containing protein [Georgenia subflava]